MTSMHQRKKILKDIDEAIFSGARGKKACNVVGLSIRTIQRWKKSNKTDQRPHVKKTPPNALSIDEKKKVLNTCNSQEFSHLTPNDIVPLLAQNDMYLASPTTFYKILREEKMIKHRLESKPPCKHKKPPALIATGPNQIWSWDITYMKSAIKGCYYYLYLFMDIWSRFIVGWTVQETESGEVASRIIEKLCLENNIDSICLHSDNGAPMTCGTMRAKLEDLGVTPSFSRPRVSNDNPYSESLFKTLKYRPAYPSQFYSIEEAELWINHFVGWYNTEHLHSGIKFVTPQQRHTGVDKQILKRRDKTYKKAMAKNPLRWSGKTRNWKHQATVELNKIPEKVKIKKIS